MSYELVEDELFHHSYHQQGLGKAENLPHTRDKGVHAYLLTPKGIEDKTIFAVRFLRRGWPIVIPLRPKFLASSWKLRKIADLLTEVGCVRLRPDQHHVVGQFRRIPGACQAFLGRSYTAACRRNAKEESACK